MICKRRVVRRTLFGTRVIIQVADSRTWIKGGSGSWDNLVWRNATAEDLRVLEAQEEAARVRNHSDIKFHEGQRVRATRSGFHRGCTGTVVFQEPAGGKVWVRRDGAEGPCYFWADELDPIRMRRAA